MSPLRWRLVSAHVRYTDNRPFVDTNRFFQTATMRRLEHRVKAGLFYFAGRYCTDWKAKYGECERCLKEGGRPFVITRECSTESGSSCMKNEEAESVDCVKHCSSGKFFHRASVQELFSSFVCNFLLSHSTLVQISDTRD